MSSLLLRSVLYMPAINERALTKARTLDVDAIIADLEDGVAVSKKEEARFIVANAFSKDYGHRFKVLRVNGLSSPYTDEDLQLATKINPDAVLFTKIDSIELLKAALDRLDGLGGSALPIWLMVETPFSVLNIEKLAQNKRVTCLVMGTNDLGYALRSKYTVSRKQFLYSFSRVILAARANGQTVLDGVYPNIGDKEGFVYFCKQGRELGFDGVTLIHPSQIASANLEYGISLQEVEWARKVNLAWDEARKKGLGVATVDGWFIENLHVDEAKRILELNDTLNERSHI
ncbi:MAG: CoA ester lyase [Proteobacteria bacterium]|nr:CoA ester lyase [Pseudomonadota bacterium]